MFDAMQATIEISMYPLSADYVAQVLAFLDKINAYEGVTVETNGVSTQLFGEYDLLMDLLKTELKAVLAAHQAMFVIKIGKGTLRYKGGDRS